MALRNTRKDPRRYRIEQLAALSAIQSKKPVENPAPVQNIKPEQLEQLEQKQAETIVKDDKSKVKKI
jgi:hypothetical protein